MRDEATIRLAIKKAEEMAETGDDVAKLAAKVTLNTLHWVLGGDVKSETRKTKLLKEIQTIDNELDAMQ